MKLYIVRHGKTEWNTENRVQGWLDSPLTTKGVNNAIFLSKRLQGVKFDYMFSSPLPRAIETATIIRGHNVHNTLPIIRDSRLKEIRLDQWQGMTIEDIRLHYKKQIEDYKGDPGNWSFDNAETLWDLTERAEDFINSLPEDGENILIVSHGVTIRALRLILFGGSVPNFWDGDPVKGTSLTVAKQSNGSWIKLLDGCIEHIEEGDEDGKNFIG
ncbi:MAG: histidine phosphatase family protein [Tissierellia bacterium]|nr:histidine phosphatase family protein [Tissierellia bacterium]